MDNKKGDTKIVAIVPAYNEERDIAGVLRELTSYSGFGEVIVVDDGSNDATPQIARSFAVRLLRHETNRGKGAAMQTGVAATDADIIFFCDADMRGFSHELLDEVVAPVRARQTDMVIAMRNSRMYWAGYVLSIIPILGGQRALTRALWLKVPAQYRERFMVETALNFYARYWGNGYQYKVVSGLRQTIKERKYGLMRGLWARMRMCYEVLLVQMQLQFAEVPRSVKSGRIALTSLLVSFGGMFLGASVLVAAYSGPAHFVRELYADKLLVDPDTPFVDTLLFLATNVSVDVIALVGVGLLASNAFFALLNAKDLRYLAYARPRVQRIR